MVPSSGSDDRGRGLGAGLWTKGDEPQHGVCTQSAEGLLDRSADMSPSYYIYIVLFHQIVGSYRFSGLLDS